MLEVQRLNFFPELYIFRKCSCIVVTRMSFTTYESDVDFSLLDANSVFRSISLIRTKMGSIVLVKKGEILVPLFRVHRHTMNDINDEDEDDLFLVMNSDSRLLLIASKYVDIIDDA